MITLAVKLRIKKLWLEGFSPSELAQMYKTTTWRIYYINKGVKRPART